MEKGLVAPFSGTRVGRGRAGPGAAPRVRAPENAATNPFSMIWEPAICYVAQERAFECHTRRKNGKKQTKNKRKSSKARLFWQEMNTFDIKF